ncbi:hypothetical protein X755_18440 [Mesorhizobium sp. LNJC405B00]|nr:hypothetical protein X755_18440 [Mesorhizobium sp. LNJC405B00]ESZ38198.1 hypothetical protein X732_19925 [Mesorhizobium sp. L2C066B000]
MATLLAWMVLMLFLCQPGLAQDKRQYLVLVTSSSPVLAERFRAGCEAVAEELKIACNVVSALPGPPEGIAAIESFISKGGSGIVLQVYGGDLAYVEVLKKARDMGVPTVIASTSLIEAASPLAEVAISIVGVDAETFVSKISDAIKADGAKDAAFCLLGFEQTPSPLKLAYGALTQKLEAAGAKRSDACPEALAFQGSFEQTLFSGVQKLLAEQDVRFVILPFRADSSYIDGLKQIAAEAGRSTVFVSAWASPFELSRTGTLTLYKAQQGERVEPSQPIQPTIQISTGAFCESCDCKTDTECKESCAECN